MVPPKAKPPSPDGRSPAADAHPPGSERRRPPAPDGRPARKADGPAWEGELLRSPHEVPDKADRVRTMFDAIAPTYELINRVFSGGRDAAWRRRAVALAVVRPDDDVLDVACGTGDLARAFAQARPRRVVGVDFSHEMLVRASARAERPGDAPTSWCEADALDLPFSDGSYSIVSCAFGVRNFADLSAGLREMHRVLRPGGRAIILEFTRPRNRLVRGVYEWYSGRFMPTVASWISRDRSGAYHYLPQSIVSFLDAERMREALRGAGFAEVSASPMTFGVVTLYVAKRAD
jgi:demethylmenaquinone methyltransferase/2-methoxy-6-polyprenyl-1,4-benzoquinol methylase